MHKTAWIVIVLLALTASSHQANAQSTTNPLDPALVTELVGEWQNELKSTLIIKSIDAQTGLITGGYRSPSGTAGNDMPLTGWVNTAVSTDPKKDHVVVISFSVRWGSFGSVTTWNGYYRAGTTPTILGQWMLTRPNTDFVWDHILTGQDRFSKTQP